MLLSSSIKSSFHTCHFSLNIVEEIVAHKKNLGTKVTVGGVKRFASAVPPEWILEAMQSSTEKNGPSY